MTIDIGTKSILFKMSIILLSGFIAMNFFSKLKQRHPKGSQASSTSKRISEFSKI